MKLRTLISISLAISAASIQAFGFSDIIHWAGTGSKQAALVIDWNDGVNPESLVWGYRWDGDSTGLDMLDAIMALDYKLVRAPGGGGPNTIYGLGYDLDNDGFSITGTGDNAYATDLDDHYKAGWFTSGFWGYFNAQDTTELPTSWGWGDGGFITGNLDDQSWEGFSWAPGFNGTAPSDPVNAPVPEPATMVALGLGLAALARKTRTGRVK